MKVLFPLTLLLLLIALTPAYSADLKNTDALNGLTEAKVVFDINLGHPAPLLLRLSFIEKTYNQLKSFGTTPVFVLAFRGGASRFVTKGDSYLPAEDLADKRKVEAWIDTFSNRGIALEQCALAAELQKIDTGDFLPQVTVVANGYISMIGYQNKGYAFVPMD